jgi:hypothetical protein
MGRRSTFNEPRGTLESDGLCFFDKQHLLAPAMERALESQTDEERRCCRGFEAARG